MSKIEFRRRRKPQSIAARANISRGLKTYYLKKGSKLKKDLNKTARRVGRVAEKSTRGIRKTGRLINENIELRNKKLKLEHTMLKGDAFDRKISRINQGLDVAGKLANLGLKTAAIGGTVAGGLYLRKKINDGSIVIKNPIAEVGKGVQQSVQTSVEETKKVVQDAVLIPVEQAKKVAETPKATAEAFKEGLNTPSDPNSPLNKAARKTGGSMGKMVSRGKAREARAKKWLKDRLGFSRENFWVGFTERSGLTIEFARKRKRHSAAARANISRGVRKYYASKNASKNSERNVPVISTVNEDRATQTTKSLFRLARTGAVVANTVNSVLNANQMRKLALSKDRRENILSGAKTFATTTGGIKNIGSVGQMIDNARNSRIKSTLQALKLKNEKRNLDIKATTAKAYDYLTKVTGKATQVKAQDVVRKTAKDMETTLGDAYTQLNRLKKIKLPKNFSKQNNLLEFKRKRGKQSAQSRFKISEGLKRFWSKSPKRAKLNKGLTKKKSNEKLRNVLLGVGAVGAVGAGVAITKSIQSSRKNQSSEKLLTGNSTKLLTGKEDSSKVYKEPLSLKSSSDSFLKQKALPGRGKGVPSSTQPRYKEGKKKGKFAPFGINVGELPLKMSLPVQRGSFTIREKPSPGQSPLPDLNKLKRGKK